MITGFKIKGYFYNLGQYSCRKYLNIVKEDSNTLTPDLMVIMMNPGSSKPIGGLYNTETSTHPDNTQHQIIKVMISCGFEYARILNLSDIINSKSAEFYKILKELDEKQIQHSIFGENRATDFNSLFKYDVPVLYAWGVHHRISGLARNAFERLNTGKPLGMAKPQVEYAYYHPLQRTLNRREEWISSITNQVLGR